jgi:hypothetical protein
VTAVHRAVNAETGHNAGGISTSHRIALETHQRALDAISDAVLIEQERRQIQFGGGAGTGSGISLTRRGRRDRRGCCALRHLALKVRHTEMSMRLGN